jgi:hypothetical protein
MPAIFLAALLMSGCAVTNTVKLYDGPERDPSQIAMLYVDPHVVITRVDSITEHPGDKSRALVHSAGKRREIAALAPGSHDLSSRFSVLCLRSDGEFPLQFTAEAGKKYRLKSEVDVDNKRWKPTIVEYSGEEIEDTFPWMTAMCKVQVNLVRLGR